jgi:hypothetical protein
MIDEPISAPLLSNSKLEALENSLPIEPARYTLHIRGWYSSNGIHDVMES